MTKKLIINLSLWIVFLVLFDQLIKKMVILYYPNLIVNNYNSVFGLVENKIVGWSLLFIAISILIIIFNKIDLSKIQSKISIILICTGAISNIIDRVLYGYVIDYINFAKISHFNLADVFIICGVIIFLFTNNKKT